MAEEKKINEGIDEEELSAAEAEAAKQEEAAKNSSILTVKLKNPIKIVQTEYTELHFDYDSLTGKDSLDVEIEIEKTTGVTVLAPALNLEYLIRISARACQEPISRDDILAMKLQDFNHIRNVTRNFMLRSDR